MVETNGKYEWFGNRCERLKALWPKYTASQIAKMFGDVTRNAIIGKANRLKLPRKKPSGNTHPRPRPKPKPVALPPLPPEPPAPAMPPEFLALTFDELEAGDCRYPEGDYVPFRFCGQMAEEGSNYCRFHKGLTSHEASNRRDNYNGFQEWRGVR